MSAEYVIPGGDVGVGNDTDNVWVDSSYDRWFTTDEYSVNGTNDTEWRWEGEGEGSGHNVLIAMLLFCLSAATIFGNALVIAAVGRERTLHSVTNYFITSLAVADLLVGLLVMPFQALYEAMNGWMFGEIWCDIWRSLDVLASTASILNLCVISLDRYWAITDPFTYPTKMSPSRAGGYIALVWICSSLISFPAIAWWRAVREGPAGYLECPFTKDLGYLFFSSIISFYGPLVVMLCTYYRIYKAAVDTTRSLKLGIKLCADGEVTLRMHRGGGASTNNTTRRSQQASTIHHASEDDDSEIGNISSLLANSDNGASSLGRNNSVRVVPKNIKNFSISRKLAKFAKEKKAAKTLGIVLGVFISMWLPFFVTNLISGFCSSCLADSEIITEVATWLGWINSGMNPIIYACMSRDFRRAFGRIICICCPTRFNRQYRQGGLRPRMNRLTQTMNDKSTRQSTSQN